MIDVSCQFISAPRVNFEDWKFAAVPRVGDVVRWDVRGAWRVDAVEWRMVRARGGMLPMVKLSPLGDAT